MDVSISSGLLNWSLWQVLDSILPTGGFAHSAGLEAAHHVGCVFNSSSLEHFAICAIDNTASLLLPFVYAASKSSSSAPPSYADAEKDLDASSSMMELWKLLDSYLHASLTNQVTRAASISQGTALLRAASTVFSEMAPLKEMRALARTGANEIHCHHAPIFGFLCGLLGVDTMTAQRAFLFVTLRDLLSAATRLNIVGPLESAQMQHRIAARAETVLSKYADRPIRDAHQTAPTLDVVQGLHDDLFRRLFRS